MVSGIMAIMLRHPLRSVQTISCIQIIIMRLQLTLRILRWCFIHGLGMVDACGLRQPRMSWMRSVL